MNSFTFYTPTEIIFGKGGGETNGKGCEKARRTAGAARFWRG